jgi:hypothetical protein
VWSPSEGICVNTVQPEARRVIKAPPSKHRR